MAKLLKSLLFITCVIGALLTGSKSVPAQPVTTRIGGADRYETALKISQQYWTTSSYAVLVSGQDFPDALCAAPLAGKYDAPILLAHQASLDSPLLKELQRLKVSSVFIVGGTNAISTSIEAQLKSSSIAFTRIQGVNRYETSAKIAPYVGTSGKAFLTSGTSFADALSISSIAAMKQIPILLTEKNTLPDSIEKLIGNSSYDSFYVIGGTSIVGDNVLPQFSSYTRIAGSNRYQTNKKVIDQFADDFNFSTLFLATGQAYADALGGAAAAVRSRSPIILTSSSDFTAQTIYNNYQSEINNLNVLGGINSISDSFLQALLNPASSKRKLVLGYATYYRLGDTSSYNSLVNHADIINQVATDTYSTDGTGNLTGTPAQNQLDYANNSNIVTLAMVANSFDGYIAKELLESPGNRQNFINNLLEQMKLYHYKGVNIDLEGIFASDRSYFTTFMQELYNTLHPQGFLVTAAVPAKTSDSPNSSWSGAYDYAQLAKYADQIILMTYDEHYLGGSAGPIASIGWVEKVIQYAVSVIPKEKLLLGLAAYGYDWSASTPKAYSLEQCNNLIAKYNIQVKFDSVSKSPYFTYTDDANVTHTVWFENSDSITYKMDLLNKYNLGGISIWRLGLENDDYWSSIAQKLK